MHKINLDGEWSFKLDPDNQGSSEDWFAPTYRLIESEKSIPVPSCWEEFEQDYEGVAWYAKEVEIKASNMGQVCRLIFEASNYRTTVWVNGKEVDSHEGGYTPFFFQVQDFLTFGARNLIVVRVVGPIVTKDITVDGIGPNQMPHWRGGLTAGIWQSVRLEFHQDYWFEQVFYKGSIADSGFRLQANILSKATQEIDAKLKISLTNAEAKKSFESTEQIHLRPGTNSVNTIVRLCEPKLWDCENPHLYTAQLSLVVNGQTIAFQSDSIGLKEFTLKEGRFYLNDFPIFLQGGFWEGVYAKHQSYPEDREVVRKEIALAKAAGLNLLRPWRRPVPPIILEEADAAGILIIASPAVECMSCWPALTTETPKRIENEIRELVLRDRNHASIIWWEMFNEVTRDEIAELIPKMSLLARSLDPTRLILDESGGWADGAHFYLPHTQERQKLSELHSYVRAPVDQKHWELYQNIGKKDTVEGNSNIKAGSPIFMSEFGFGGWPEIATNYERFQKEGNPLLPAYRHHAQLTKAIDKALLECELSSIFADVDSICRATQEVQARGNKRQLEALLANPVVSGYCIHAFTDGDWILGAGLIDNWQRPKAAYHAIAEANKNPRLLCFVNKRNLSTLDNVSMRIVFRDSSGTIPARIELSSTEKSHSDTSLNWTHDRGLSECYSAIPPDLLRPGTNEIIVNAYALDNTFIRSTKVELFVVNPNDKRALYPVVIYDPTGDLVSWRKEQKCETVDLKDWVFKSQNCLYVFSSEDVSRAEDIPLIDCALKEVHNGTANAIFLEPPSTHEAAFMIREYDACPVAEASENLLLESGVFPFKLIARPSFSFWEGTAHIAKSHPIFDGLPSNCLMDEPYQEVAPVESLYELEASEALSHSITWYRPEVIATKVKKRTYLGGEELWHGTNLAVKVHGQGRIILSTLILRSKASSDPVASRILSNMVHYTFEVNTGQTNVNPADSEVANTNALEKI